MGHSERKRRFARQVVRSHRPSSEKLSPQDNPASLAVSVVGRDGVADKPVVERTMESETRGMYGYREERFALGYVLSGRKNIFDDNRRLEALPGDVFFISRGIHTIEDIPSRSRRGFEQVVFYYTPEQAARALANLTVNFDLDTCVEHSCERCMRRDHVVATGWTTLSQFFESTAAQLKTGFFENDRTAELLAFTTLMYHVVSHPNGCLRTRVLGSTDPEQELMERIVHEYIYKDTPLDELARRSNRSLSSFKKQFKDRFGDAPHRWVVGKRLMHSRLLVVQTVKSTTEIARECHFGNCSHFIKLFRDEFGLTPFQYRRRYRTDMSRGAAGLTGGQPEPVEVEMEEEAVEME